MTAGVVSFVLSRGFGVPISGKRAKLIELVLARYPASDALEYREAVARREAAAEVVLSQARLVAREREIIMRDRVIAARDQMNAIRLVQEERYSVQQLLNSTWVLVNQFEYAGSMSLLESHPSYVGYVANSRHTIQTMMVFVVKFLTTIYRLETNVAVNMPELSELSRQREINQRMSAKLNNESWVGSAFRSATIGCRIQFTPAGIVHMTRMAKMYNYRRMLQADQTQFNYSHIVDAPAHSPPVYSVQMKPLNIRVALVEDDGQDKKNKEAPVCGVCFDDLPDLKTVTTGCNHVFCSVCIGGVARTRGIKSFINCPCCRTEIAELSVMCQEEATAVIAGLAPVPI